MARSTEEIQDEIIQAKNDDPTLAELNSPSKTAIWRVWTWIMATAIQLHEQYIDQGIVEMEQIAREAIAGTAQWLQQRALEFQYSATDPQVITVIDGRAAYPTINEDLRIVTRCSVKEQANGRVQVKTAKGDVVLEPLANDELNALIGYLDKVGFVGIPLDVVSLFADRFRFQGKIYYSGEYVETTVKAAVIDSINEYLSNVSINEFDGTVTRENVIDAIQSVPGVVGVDTLNVLMNGRPEQDPLGGGTNISIERKYETFAGYIIEEDTAGNTFEDTITMSLN